MILETHKPVDVVVLMLGTNDCKTMYDTSAEVIGRGVERLLDQIRSSTPDSKILLMSPIALGEGVGEAGYDPEFDESSVALAEAVYAKLKEMLAGEKENAQIPA